MQLTKAFVALIIHLAVTNAKCGTADACTGTDICQTFVKTTPTSTTFATTTVVTCVPTPTCIGVYGDCVSGGAGEACCSSYCAATKCRPTDKKWPNCSEDFGLCEKDDDCCYENKCVGGLCRRQ